APAPIRRFIDADQDGDAGIEIVAEVIPLVRALPLDRQMPGGRMGRIHDLQCRRLDYRMPAEVVADERSVPWPLVTGVGRRVDADEAPAVLDESCKRSLFVCVEHLAGRTQENN